LIDDASASSIQKHKLLCKKTKESDYPSAAKSTKSTENDLKEDRNTPQQDEKKSPSEKINYNSTSELPEIREENENENRSPSSVQKITNNHTPEDPRLFKSQ